MTRYGGTMSDINERVFRLFQQTGLGDDPRVYKNPLLTQVDRAHFRYVLFNNSAETLIEPFESMRRDIPRLRLSATESKLLEVEQRLCPLIDSVVNELESESLRIGKPLSKGGADLLWRRIAFATLTYVQMEKTPLVMLNEMVGKVVQMFLKPGGFMRLESFVMAHGYENVSGEKEILATLN
jgi:hypothetical protein